jgi:hypothetical protein
MCVFSRIAKKLQGFECLSAPRAAMSSCSEAPVQLDVAVQRRDGILGGVLDVAMQQDDGLLGGVGRCGLDFAVQRGDRLLGGVGRCGLDVAVQRGDGLLGGVRWCGLRQGVIWA